MPCTWASRITDAAQVVDAGRGLPRVVDLGTRFSPKSLSLGTSRRSCTRATLSSSLSVALEKLISSDTRTTSCPNSVRCRAVAAYTSWSSRNFIHSVIGRRRMSSATRFPLTAILRSHPAPTDNDSREIGNHRVLHNHPKSSHLRVEL